MLNLVAEYVPYYAKRAGESDRARQVGWRDTDAQEARFRQFLRAISHPTDADVKVADVGCGLGDLLPFLRSHGFIGLSYTGYDIIPEMVEAAAAHHRDPKAQFKIIQSDRDIEQTDYCFASGIFNDKAGYGDEAWVAHVKECVRGMAARSRCAIAFNMLSIHSDEDKRQSYLHYADPAGIFDWCKREITPDVALFHDYGHWDFTILLRMDRAQARDRGAS
jgi:SAM-dependent methyltransferase